MPEILASSGSNGMRDRLRNSHIVKILLTALGVTAKMTLLLRETFLFQDAVVVKTCLRGIRPACPCPTEPYWHSWYKV
mgnify:CR=1 FL=1